MAHTNKVIVEEGEYFLVDYSNSVIGNEIHLINESTTLPFITIKGDTWSGKTISPDGKYFAFALGSAINTMRLMVLNLMDNS